MRIIYMGTPEFAVLALERLVASSHTVAAVVTQPDRHTGRGQHLQSPAVKLAAERQGLPVLQPTRIRTPEFEETLRAFNPDAIVVAAFGRILPANILKLPRFGCINIHASLLPKYRGAAPIQWAIINGEKYTGVTIMQMDEGLDTGNIIAFEQIDILDDDNTESVSNMLSVAGAELIVGVLDQVESQQSVTSIPQNHSQATFAPILKKSDGLIDWNLTNEEIICRMRGLQPWPTAFSFLHGKVWKFFDAEPFKDPDGLYFPRRMGPDAKYLRDPDPGRVTALIKGRGFTVKTGDGHLLVQKVQPAGKKQMTGIDVVNGHVLKSKDEFISEPAFLEGTDEVK